MRIVSLAICCSLELLRCHGSAAIFDYDALDRVSAVVRSESVRTNYSYDGSGNRARKTIRLASLSSPTPSVLGQYLGAIVLPSPDTGPARIVVNVGKNGAFTAGLRIGGRKVQWKGTFTMSGDGGGTWAGTVNDAVLGPLELRLELPPGGGQMTVTVTNNGQTNTALLALAGQLGSGEVPAGSYTVLLPANPDFPGAGHPQGDGYATLAVTTKGVVKLVGKLGDGTSISQSGALTSDGRFQVFIPLYIGGGVLTGWVDFVPTDEVSDFNGTLRWSKPAVTGDAFYSSGFDLEIDLLGSKFTPPSRGQRILGLQNSENNGVLLLGNGNLSGDQRALTLTLDAANKVRFTAPGIEAPALTITARTGLFTGSFFHPQLGRRAKISGVVFQKQRLASGFFLGQDQSGYATLHATATDTLLLPASGNGNPSNEHDNPPGTTQRFGLSVASVNGTVARNPNLTSYAVGTTVQLTANPSPGYIFDHWSGDASGAQNPLPVTIDANKTITAVFATAPPSVSYTISATASPANGGVISGTGTFASGAAVNLTATASNGYNFTNWTEAGTPVSSNSSYSFTATGDRSLIANFTANPPSQPTQRFADDFSDNSLDAGKWTVAGNTVTEANGVMNVLTTVTDAGGKLNSVNFPISRTGPLTLTRKVRLHFGNEYYMARLTLKMGTLGEVSVFYGNMSYNGSPHQAVQGFVIARNSANPHSRDSTGNISLAIPPVWDQWFDEKITYDPATGALEYFINNVSKLTYNVGALPAGDAPMMQIHVDAWGWWTGHEHLFDDLVVKQGSAD